MMTLESNKVKMHYASFLGISPEYKLDINGNRIIEYVDDDGTTVYAETGKNISVYSEPKEIHASISESGGDAQPQEYGLSIADYQAVLLYGRNEYQIKEGDIIWVQSDIEYEHGGQEIEVEIDGESHVQKVPIKTSADYVVIKTPDSLNFTKAILKAVNK